MITINEKTCEGQELRISDEKVYVDGALQEVEGKQINISVTGKTHCIIVDTCNKFDMVGVSHKITVNKGNVHLIGKTHYITVDSGNVHLTGKTHDMTINNGELITPESKDEITEVNKVYLDIQTAVGIISSVENNISLLINDITLEKLALGFELGKQTAQLLVVAKKLQELSEQFENEN